MKHRLHILLTFFIVTDLMLSGCALEHHAVGVFLSTDRQLYEQLTDPINITLASRVVVPNQYHSVQYEVMDNGRVVEQRAISRDTQNVTIMDPFPHTYGLHSISARVRPYNSETDNGDWVTSSPAMVCIFVGSDPPDTIPPCSVYGFPQHIEISTETPAILTIATETPVVTPLIIIRPENNNNNGGNGGPSGGASGCGAYGDKTSCDLAGCSWNGSACTVSP